MTSCLRLMSRMLLVGSLYLLAMVTKSVKPAKVTEINGTYERHFL